MFLAQEINISGQPIKGPLEISGIPSSDITLATIVNRVVQFIIPMAAIILLFVLIWGGYDILMSGGSAEKLKSAQGKITAGIVGFILLISSYLIVKLISVIFGVGGGIL